MPRLHLLGTASLRAEAGFEGAAGDQLGPGKPLALLALLACAPRRIASREQIAEALWADVDTTAARHTLRQTVWAIRRKIGADLLVSDGDCLQLKGDITCDRDAFLAAVERSDAETAFDCYTGDFFPGFAAPGAAGFEQWADVERTRLRSLFVGAAGRVVRARLESGRARDALAVARRARDLAPGVQATWRMVVEAHVAADDLVGARVELTRLLKLLADDDLEPEPATAQWQRRLEEHGRPSAKASADTSDDSADLPSGELVGRDAQFAALVRAADDAWQGMRVHVHLTAPAGLGKTRLLDGLAARLRAQRGARPRVVVVRAVPAERSLPYAFLGQLVGALVPLRGATSVVPSVAGTLTALSPAASTYLAAPPDPATGDDAHRRRASALSELLQAIAEEAPVALCIDDVHWMDAESRSALAVAIARTERAPLLIVTAARPRDDFVDQVPGVRVLTLAALDVDDITELLKSIARLPEAPWTEPLPALLLAASGGSPLVLLTSMRFALDQQVLALAGGEWQCPSPQALFALLGAGEALQRRLAALPDRARALLLRLAVVGAAVPAAGLATLADGAIDEELRLLESRAFVQCDADGYRPAHDETARAVVDAASPAERHAAHLAALHWLSDPPGAAPRQLARAVWHAWRAPAPAALDATFARLVLASGAAGDRTRQLLLAHEALGADADATECQALVARLPAPLRRRKGATGWWLAAAAIITAGVLWRRTPEPAPTATVVLHAETADGRERWLQVSVRAATFLDAGPLDAEETVAPPVARALGVVDMVDAMLDDGSILGARLATAPVSNAYDVVRLLPSGEIRPLADGPRDQVGPRLSPDRRWIAYFDRAASPLQHADVMVQAAHGGGSRNLTSSPEEEGAFVWSPGSDSLAFMRVFDDSVHTLVCSRALAGGDEQCQRMPASLTLTRIDAWRGDGRLVAQGELRASGRAALLLLDRTTKRTTVIDSSAALYQIDPSGSLALCVCEVNGVHGPVPAVFAMSAPRDKRAIRYRGRWLDAIGHAGPFWGRHTDSLVAVVVVAPDSANVGDPVQLVVTGRSVTGDLQPILNRHYTSLTPDVARVDASGLVLPLRVGRARIQVRAERRFTETVVLTVVPHAERLLLTERWTDWTVKQWYTFGTPRPTVHVTAPTRLSINGDERLSSGVISRLTFDGAGGLGVRVRFRLEGTQPQWQRLQLALDPVASDSAITNWGGRSEGLFPLAWRLRDTRTCILSAPRREGGPSRGLVGISAGSESVAQRAFTGRFDDGAWHTAEIQLLRDGRCAYSLDGQLLGVSRGAIATDLPLRVLLHGAAVGTDVEVGAVDVWRGVRPDGPWAVSGTTARH